jgi:hypothetical protein
MVFGSCSDDIAKHCLDVDYGLCWMTAFHAGSQRARSWWQDAAPRGSDETSVFEP